MTELSIDIETYGEEDLTKVGAYRYVDAPSFEILLIAYAFDDDPVQQIDVACGEPVPALLRAALEATEYSKCAFNANFERTGLGKFTGRIMLPEQWYCTMIHASTLGLPRSLERVAKVLGFPEDKQKMSVGKSLISYFCKPCKPTRANGGRTRNLPAHDPAKWDLFKEYNRQDVEVERAIRRRLERWQPPEHEHRLWYLDQRINDRGVRVDPVLANQAIAMDAAHTAALQAEAVRLTGLDNPRAVGQLKKWLAAEGLEVVSLNKENLPALLAGAGSEIVRRVLELRQELSRTSTSKYTAMMRSLCSDGRVHGSLQFYGAVRTGRWAGRIIQPQNLPQNHLPDLALARELVRAGNAETIDLLFGSISDTLSQLIRTALVPSDGCRFVVADFNAIEARVIAWYAGENWVLDVFCTHGKIYEATADNMFHIPIESIAKGSPERQRGKVAQLALGYQGAVGALKKMDKTHQIPEEDMPGLVESWRTANPHIVHFWYDVQAAAIRAVQNRTTVSLHHGLRFIYEAGMLFLGLPSGRRLAYCQPQIKRNRFGKPALTFMGTNQTTQKWERQETYGGSLVENIVQATARDCLKEAVFRLEAAGYPIVFHVHDEIIADMPRGRGSAAEMCDLMGQPIDWAPGLPLKAAGFEAEFYQKD